jgi:rubrerythrin
MTIKRAWDSETQHYINREDRARTNDATREVTKGIIALLKQIKVKGATLYEWAYQFGGIAGLAKQTDTEIKRGYFQFRKALEQFFGQMEGTMANVFFNAYGKNPQDWNFIKLSKRSKLFQRRADQMEIVELKDLRQHFETTISEPDRGPDVDHKDDLSQAAVPEGQVEREEERDQAPEFQEPTQSGPMHPKSAADTSGSPDAKNQYTCPNCGVQYFDSEGNHYGCPNCTDTFSPKPRTSKLFNRRAGISVGDVLDHKNKGQEPTWKAQQRIHEWYKKRPDETDEQHDARIDEGMSKESAAIAPNVAADETALRNQPDYMEDGSLSETLNEENASKTGLEVTGGTEDDIASEIISDPALDYLVETFGADDAVLHKAITDHFAPVYPSQDLEPIVDRIIETINTDIEVAASEEPIEASKHGQTGEATSEDVEVAAYDLLLTEGFSDDQALNAVADYGADYVLDSDEQDMASMKAHYGVVSLAMTGEQNVKVDNPDPIVDQQAMVATDDEENQGPIGEHEGSFKTAEAPSADVIVKLTPHKSELLGLLEDPNGFCMKLTELLGVEVDTSEGMEDVVHAYYVHHELAEQEDTYAGVRILINQDLIDAWASMEPAKKSEMWQKFLSLMDESIVHENVHHEQDERGELTKDRWEKQETDAANLMTPQEIEAHAKDAYVELQNQGIDDLQILQAIKEDDQYVLSQSDTCDLYRDQLADTPEWFKFLKLLAQNVAA